MTPGPFYYVAEPSHVPGAGGRQFICLDITRNSCMQPFSTALGLCTQVCILMSYVHEDALDD